MGKILKVLFIIIICIITILWKIIKFLFGVLKAHPIIIKIAIFLVVAIIVLGLIGIYLEERKMKKWFETKARRINEGEMYLLFSRLVKDLKDNNVKNQIFNTENMKYGRACAFLEYFNTSIYNEDVYYFSVKPSKDINKFREYGTLITNKGIYVSVESGERQEFIKFDSLCYATNWTENDIACIRLGYAVYKNNKLRIKYENFNCYTSLDLSSLVKFLNKIINADIPKIIYQDTVYGYSDSDYDFGKKIEDEFDINSQADNINFAGIQAILQEGANLRVNEIKNLEKGAQGHGYIHENVNNAVDRLLGNEVTNSAQILDEHGRQVKSGADKIVNGIEIQSKCYKTAAETINSCFNKSTGEAIYINRHGNMMRIEVPYDQYEGCIENIAKKIQNGQVPNETNPDNAYKYVKRGIFSYDTIRMAKDAGTIEGLMVDGIEGLSCSAVVGSINAVLAFSLNIWNGKSSNEAVKSAIACGSKTALTGTFFYVLTNQLSRESIVIGSAVISNPIASIAEELTKKINNSPIPINFKQSTEFIANSINVCIVFGPDMFRFLEGRISVKQLAKNAACSGASLVGAAAGNAVLPIFGILIGSKIAGALTKSIADVVLGEDDSIRMMRILKEEYLDVITISFLNADERKQLSEELFEKDNIRNFLMDMYASENPRDFARANLQLAVTELMKKKQVITKGMYLGAFVKYFLFG